MSQYNQEDIKEKLSAAYIGFAEAEKRLESARLDKEEYLREIQYYETLVIKAEGELAKVDEEELRKRIQLIADTVLSPNCCRFKIKISEKDLIESKKRNYTIISSVDLDAYEAKYEYTFEIWTKHYSVMKIVREILNGTLQKGEQFTRHLEGCGCCHQYTYTSPVNVWEKAEY